MLRSLVRIVKDNMDMGFKLRRDWPFGLMLIIMFTVLIRWAWIVTHGGH